jgi:hypothetical protein
MVLIHDFSRLYSSRAAARRSGDISSTEMDRRTWFLVNICSSGWFDYF